MKNSRSDAPIRVITPAWLVLACASLLCVLLLNLRSQLWAAQSYRFMIWNLFLAWLPLLAAGGAARLANRPAALLKTVLIACWLLLFPNAPYMVTDWIHPIMNGDYRWVDQTSLRLWVEIILFTLFAWIGLLLGYLSMRLVHELILRSPFRMAGWPFVVAVSFLGGFGVYLGRFARHNSWDVLLYPQALKESVLEGLGGKGIVFSLLFGAVILTVYLTLYGLERRKEEGT